MRGQTQLDFAIGASVFLIVVVYVLAFVPGMLQPFVGGMDEEPVAANRVADSLSQGMLGDPAEPYVLDSECTLAFFEEGDGDSGHNVPSDCRFQDDDVSARERVGFQGRHGAQHDLRIRLVGDADGDGTSEVLCNSGGTLSDTSPGSCSGVPYVVGDEPPDSTGSVVVVRRVVYLPDGQGVDASLLVEVW